MVIVKESQRLVGQKSKFLSKCKDGLLKGSRTGGCPDLLTTTKITKAEGILRSKILRACAGVTSEEAGFSETCEYPGCEADLDSQSLLAECVECTAHGFVDDVDGRIFGSLREASPDKLVLKCQRGFGKELAKLFEKYTKAMQICEYRRIRGSVEACPDVKTDAVVERLGQKALDKLTKGCPGDGTREAAFDPGSLTESFGQWDNVELTIRRFAEAAVQASRGNLPARDPEQDSTRSVAWLWEHGLSSSAVTDHLVANIHRLVDLDRWSRDSFSSVTVANSGPYARPSYWWPDLDEAGVVTKINEVNGRLLDIAPFVVNGQTRFAISMIRNEGSAAKAWWWNYDRTQAQVEAEILQFDMRLIDLEVYEKGGQTLYAYVGIENVGIDLRVWWSWFELDIDSLVAEVNANQARLLDLEMRPDGKFAAVAVKNDGAAWWWGVGLTEERVAEFVGTRGARIVDVERFNSFGSWRYAIIGIDNVETEEARRLRPIAEEVFDDGQFGPNVIRGFLVKEVNGPVLADIGGGLRFQPASTLKLLPHLYAVQEVDVGNASLDGTQVNWLEDPSEQNASCLQSGTAGSASYREALPTMMWYSHNRTLDAFLDIYPPWSSDVQAETLTSRAQGQWGMQDTTMYLGCTGEWLNNRSTLYDIATLYEGVENLTFFGNASSRDIFWNNMINVMQGDCSAGVGVHDCTCPSYAPNCPGNTYQSPYLAGAVWTSLPSEIAQVVTEEGGVAFDVSSFLDEVLMRGKGGGTEVFNSLPAPGWWEGSSSDSFHVTLPFKDSIGNIVPRTFVVAFFVNGWDPYCGGQVRCEDAINGEFGDLEQLKAELLRGPIRMAVASWQAASTGP